MIPSRSLATLAATSYLPSQASSVAGGVDAVFGFLFWLSAFFLAVILGLTVLFVVRYRQRPGRLVPEPSPDHDNRLELVWSAIPLLLVFGIFGASTKVYLEMTAEAPTGGALRVSVTGRRWSWWFDHPGGKGSAELHVVQGRQAELVLGSPDVIHSLYLPDFRMKQDAVPGRYTRMLVTPTRAGSFPIVCAEFCGTNHSRMNTVAVVHPDQASFDAWARQGMGPDASLVDQGKLLFAEKACSSCHSDDGSPGAGPSVKGLWGRREKMSDGGTVLVDENYVRESMLNPGARITAGFEDLMPPVPLEEREILAIIAYLQSLKEAP